MSMTTRLGIAVLCLGVAAGCNATAEAPTPRATGYVEATETSVSAKVPGRVVEVLVDEGTRVEAGQLLAELSTSDTDHLIARLTAERAYAESQLRLLIAGSSEEDVSVAQAQVATATSDLHAAETDLAAARRDAARFAQLVAANAGARKVADDAAARADLAEARVAVARDRVTAAEAALARVRAGARPQEVAGARARIAAIDAQLADARSALEEARLVAPVAGVVTARLIEPGELLGPRAPAFVILDLDRAWVTAYVEAPLVGTLQLGDEATVRTDAGVALTGRVTFIAAQAEFTPRNVQTPTERARLIYRARITVDNRAGALTPGMPVEVTWTRR
jgi:HlyD family secretion protein